jgi:hypothetical protein
MSKRPKKVDLDLMKGGVIKIRGKTRQIKEGLQSKKREQTTKTSRKCLTRKEHI